MHLTHVEQLWIKPLRERDIIPEPRRTDFLEQVFWNIHDIIAVNSRLRDALNKRQKQYAIVERIGDILLDAVKHFNPFVSYGAHQLYGKYEFEKEKSTNPAFAEFVEVRGPYIRIYCIRGITSLNPYRKRSAARNPGNWS